MTNLILPSLEISGFRAFPRLCIERLGGVNLITGKNNVGKTCLLEALWLYASRGSLAVMRDLLAARDETVHLPTRGTETAAGQSARFLFYGRKKMGEQPEPIRIGPLQSPSHTLTIAVSWFKEYVDKQGQRHFRPIQSPSPADMILPGLNIQLGDRRILNYPLEIDLGEIRLLAAKPPVEEIPCRSIPANGLDKDDVSRLWDGIALTDMEEDVLASLQIIAPEVERISLVADQKQGNGRIPIVKTAGIDEPIPLRSLGEGMNRLFGLTLALVNAKGGILLVDEVESGLHYSVHLNLWRLMLYVARRLNVQVFATTHSWDCIQGFQKAAQEYPEDALLISLRAKRNAPGQTAAVLFDHGELGIATRDRIEVR